MTDLMTNALSTEEREQLASAEAKIARGLQSVFDVGEGLREIRDGRLYRDEYGTFEDFCFERCGFGRERAYRMIQAFEVKLILLPIGNKISLPGNEAQARELVPLLGEPTQLAAVWSESVRRGGDRVTAAIVRNTRDDMAPPVIDGESYDTEPEQVRPNRAPEPEALTAPVVERPGSSSAATEQTLPPMPAGQEVADAMLAEIDESVAAPDPAPARPYAWDPTDRRQHEDEVQRRRDIETARRFSDSIVTTFRSAVATIVSGCRYGERGLVTPEMVSDLRDALALLEAEL